jgi:hypothetical protein
MYLASDAGGTATKLSRRRNPHRNFDFVATNLKNNVVQMRRLLYYFVLLQTGG